MNYKVIDKETYYRKGVFRHFTEDCACSTSMTAKIDVTDRIVRRMVMKKRRIISILKIS